MFKIINVIREYLVSLGWHVDQTSFNAAKRSLGDTTKLVSTFADTSIVKYAAAGVAVTGFVGTAVAALYQFTVGLANAELKNEMFARKMWMSNDAALSYKNTLDALGVSVQDLYLSPELMNKFIDLRKQASNMELPGGNFENAMKGVRDITFEFQRFKLEASYAVYWVGYYLTQYLAGPMSGIQGGLKGINDTITQNMPQWTKKIASFLADAYRMLHAGSLTLKEILYYFGQLTPAAKAFMAVLAAGALGFLNPVTLMAGAFAGLLLLIDDYDTWVKGGKSAWGDTWKDLTENGDLDRLKQSVMDLVENLNALLKIDVGENGENSWIGELIKGADYLFDKLNSILYWIRAIKGETDLNQKTAPSDYWNPDLPENDPKKQTKFADWFVVNAKDTVRKISQRSFKDPFLNLIGMGPLTTNKAPNQSFSEWNKTWQNNFGSGGIGNYLQPKANNTVSYNINPIYNINSTADALTLANSIDSKNISIITRTQKGAVMG